MGQEVLRLFSISLSKGMLNQASTPRDTTLVCMKIARTLRMHCLQSEGV